MERKIILLTGPICAGKSTVAKRLATEHNIVHIETRQYLNRKKEGIAQERGAMQEFGEKLDRKTRGGWVRDELQKDLDKLDPAQSVVVDSIRALNQIHRIRESYGNEVVQLHLEAAESSLEARYSQRKKKGQSNVKEFDDYKTVLENATERGISQLRDDADVVILTDRCTEDDVIVRVEAQLGLNGKSYEKLVDVLVGGQYGSEGKGQIAAYLASEYGLLIRVGGPNAGHKVFEEPIPYTFHQLPSGTRSSEADLLLGPGTSINLEVLLKEIADCSVSASRLSIDPQAVIITPRHISLEERSIKKSIGSTAQGVGEAAVQRVRRRPNNMPKFAKDIVALKPFVRPALERIQSAMRNGDRMLLEGTQGTGLSLFHGHYPHVTSRDTTVAGCLAEAGISPSCVRKIVMVCRTYPIRVQSPEGADSGPMCQEIELSEIAYRSGINLAELRETERTSTTNKPRRIAEFDWKLLRRASLLNAPTDIALTFADYLSVENRDARRFDQFSKETILFIEEIERVTMARVSLVSTRFHTRAVVDRRRW